MRTKLPKRMVDFLAVYDIMYDHFSKANRCICLDSQTERLMNLRGQHFVLARHVKALSYASEQAAKEVGLAHNLGAVYAKNHHGHCWYLILPGRKSTYVDNGKEDRLFFLRDVLIVRVEKVKEPVFDKGERAFKGNLYCFEMVKKLKKANSILKLIRKLKKVSEGSEPSSLTMSDQLLARYLKAYLNQLACLDIVQQEPFDRLEGWSVGSHQRLGYYVPGKVWYDIAQEETVLDRYLPMALHEGDGLWFSAAVFSLVKPLFSLCGTKVNTDFALHLQCDLEVAE